MNSKITIPIVIAISVIVTAGIMYSINFEQEPQITQIPEPEIIYVDKSTSEYFEGTDNVKKIASQEQLKSIYRLQKWRRKLQKTKEPGRQT